MVAMLLPGVIKRGSRAEPIITIDGRGVTIDLPWIGTIPWDRIRSAQIAGTAWWTGQRLNHRIHRHGAEDPLHGQGQLGLPSQAEWRSG